MDLLNLPNLKILEKKEDEYGYLFVAEPKTPLSRCPQCGFSDAYKHGKKEYKFMHTPMDKRVGIKVIRQRYKCKNCNSTFLDNLPDMDESRSMSIRLLGYIRKKSIERTHVSIAESVGVSEGTVRNIFREHIAILEKMRNFDTPRWLGIDEIHLIGKPRCIFTNIEQRTLVDLLTDRNKDTILRYLRQIPDKKQIELVTMDMWQPYKVAVYSELPHAKVVVDKFHVVRTASYCLDLVRKQVRSGMTDKERRSLMHDRFILLKRNKDLSFKDQLTLDYWTLNIPLLGKAYKRKEEFYDIWDSPDKKEAMERFKSWLKGLDAEEQAMFKPLVTACNNWMTEMLNYFDHPVTNAYTESFNNLIRATNRMGRGYSFDALRAKMIFSTGAYKIVTPKFDMDSFDKTAMYEVMASYHIPNYGVDISTLANLLEQVEK